LVISHDATPSWVLALASQFVVRMIFGVDDKVDAKAMCPNKFFELEKGIWQPQADQGFN
jgi:hypothetical protein